VRTRDSKQETDGKPRKLRLDVRGLYRAGNKSVAEMPPPPKSPAAGTMWRGQRVDQNDDSPPTSEPSPRVGGAGAGPNGGYVLVEDIEGKRGFVFVDAGTRARIDLESPRETEDVDRLFRLPNGQLLVLTRKVPDETLERFRLANDEAVGMERERLRELMTRIFGEAGQSTEPQRREGE
jgi:hypothetical protein